MTKIYAASLLLSCFVCTFAFSQKSVIANSASFKHLKKPGLVGRETAAGCDTINIPEPDNWSFTIIPSGEDGEVNGFVTGNNVYGDQEKAAYFDVSSSANTYLTKVWVAFGVANSNTSANLSKIVPVKVYDGTTGTPGTLLTTVNTTLGAIKTNVDNGYYTEITFPAAITLPASKKFFVSVDISKLIWTSTVKDSLAIFSTEGDEVVEGENGFGFEKYKDKWNTFYNDGWPADYGLYIHPFVSDNPTCALTGLPVTLSSYKGERTANGNLLSWTTATEQNNKGFEILRSADGKNFSSISFVNTKAVNASSTSGLSYQFTDTKYIFGDSYYRLQQIDKDGKATVSGIVLIKGLKTTKLGLSNIYPNPTVSQLRMVLSAPSNDRVNIIVTDLAGKVVMNKAAQVITGSNNLSLNVDKLPAGSYIIKAICASGRETAVSKFVKQ